MEKNALAESIVKGTWLDYKLEMATEKDFKCLSLESLLNHNFFKVLKLYLADTVLNIKVRYLESFSKIGYMSLIGNLLYPRER